MVATLGEILPRAARLFGSKTALVIDGSALSFTDLETRSNAVANGLLGAGVVPGDRVMVYGANSWQWMVCYFAAAKAGAVVIPVNVMLTPKEVGFVIEDSGTRCVMAAAASGEPLLDLKGKGGLSDIVLWGDKVPAGATSLDLWLSLGADTFTPVTVDPITPGAICYTSGTTGHPKGAVQSHRAILGSAKGTILMCGRTEQDVVAAALPFPHVYGSCVYNAALLAGSKLVWHSRFAEEPMLASLQEHRATMMDGVPTAYYYLLAHKEFDSYDLSSLKACTVAGQSLPAAKSLEWSERVKGCPVLELWGMTELAGAATANPYWGDNKPGTIGLPYPGTFCRIADIEDASKEMPAGERGELMVKGPLVMDGYYRNEKGTRDAIRPDGWMHTGDIATMDADGYFTIVDRKKDMIITAGFNVYPAELERVLCMHPSVALAAVRGVPDEAKGELAKAYVMLKPGTQASGQELADHCRQHLAAYKTPRAVQFVEQVPITSSGKIMRRLLDGQDDGTRVLGTEKIRRA